MAFVYHANTFLRVNRLADELQAECTLLSNDLEAVAWVYADVKTLHINHAAWSLYRSNNRPPGHFILSDFIGVEAYFYAGPALKRVLGVPGQELPRELISECIRGILQAENFFFQERGFITAQQYDAYGKEMYVGACRYYSHLDKIDQPGNECVEDIDRSYNLFNRGKTVSIQRQESDFIITASFIDSFHHLSIVILLDENDLVKKISGDYARAPDKICYENTDHLSKFLDQYLPGMGKKEIAALAGGGEGCHHLVDLIYETAKAMAQVKIGLV